MMNEDNNQRPGPDGSFKVKLKKGGDDIKYLTSTDNGATLKWSSTDTPVMFWGDKDGPSKNWYILVNQDMKFLAVAGDSASLSGNCSDSKWHALSNYKLPYHDGSTVKYLGEGTGDRVLLTTSGSDIEIE